MEENDPGVSSYKIWISLQGFIVGVDHPIIPPTLAKPTLLQYDCTPIAIYAPPTDPSFLCRTPYTIGDGNIV